MKMPLVKQEILTTISAQYMNEHNQYIADKIDNLLHENPVLLHTMERVSTHVANQYGDPEIIQRLTIEIFTAQMVIYEAIKQQMICDELNGI